MLKTAHKILTGLIIALGVLHTLVTFCEHDSFSVEAMWFASAGVAIILAGFLNIVLLRDVAKDTVVWTLCIITNLIFAVMFVLALLVLPQPQVFVGAGLFIAVTVLSLIKSRK